jgi:integrase
VDQGKTGARVVLPFDLRLEAFGKSLGDVYEQCRQTGVLSPYLIHQTESRGNSPAGRQIWVDTISRRFTDTLGRLGLTFEDKTPPTFHEIRSLSERLYAAQGNVNTQELLGHKDPRTTQLYHDARGAEWVRVTIRA